jgi:hypothetical protein
MRPAAKPDWMDVPPIVYQYLLGRIIMLAVFVGALVLLIWSVNRLQPLNQELQAQTTSVSQLADQVERMQANWNPEEAEQVAKTMRETRAKLFATPEEYTRWQQEIQSHSTPLGLDASSELLKAKPTADNRFASTPAVIAIEVQPTADVAATNSPYVRLLEFGQSLVRPSKLVDVTELTVSGNSNSITQARIEVQLWSQVRARK